MKHRNGRYRYALAALGVSTALLTAAPAVAQAAAVFDLLEGRWHGEGQLMGRAAVFEMRWQQPPAGFVVLSFSNGFVNDDDERIPVLDAVAVYRQALSDPKAVWLDSRGERVRIRWEARDSTLTAHWSSGSEEGRTEYRVVSGSEILVVDYVLAGDEWREFGQARYRRIGGVRRR